MDEDHSILGEEDMDIRLRSVRRFDFDLEQEYRSPEHSHDDLAKSIVSIEGSAKKDGLVQSNVSTDDTAQADGLAEFDVPTDLTAQEDGLAESNVPTDTAQEDGLAESNVPVEDKTKEDGVPEIGMEFDSEEQAYDFYNRYGGKLGFSVRKEWLNKSRNGIVQSRRYCCNKEGFRKKDPRDKSMKNPSKETRTGCLAQMIIALRPNSKYRVVQFEATHNHELVSPDRVHLLKSQRKLSLAQVAKVDNMDSSGFSPMDSQEEVHENFSYPPVDYKNYLRSKRMKAMRRGDAGGMLQYFQRMQLENPLFFYAIQLDIYDKITNIFWADAKMVVDYDYFGDVVCFDTTYRTNKYERPFALFIGVNHHKQTVIFGAALIYDETPESFKWLFETFIEAMSGKMPKTILTDQDAAMADAIALALPETYHRICVWQIYQNSLKHLSTVFGGSKSFDKDFSNCLFDYEEEEDFIQAWESMLEKYDLRENTWLQKLYKEREKWALVYGRLAFCADMKSAQRSGNVNSVLRSYLNNEYDLVKFFHHFERLVEDRRCEEIHSSYEMSQSTSRLLIPVKMLKQVADFYTPAVFEMFKAEYVRCLDFVVNLFSEVGTVTEYKITMEGKPCEQTVTFNSSDDTIVCSCRKFEFAGILCCHALKVLDHRNIKMVPAQYILKRWTKDAKVGTVGNSRDFSMQVDPKLDLVRRYKELCCNIAKIAARAAETEDAYKFAAFYSDKMLQEVEGILKRTYNKGANHFEGEYAESLRLESADSSSERVESLLNGVRVWDDGNGMNVADVCHDDNFRVKFTDSAKSTKSKGVKRKKRVDHGECITNGTEGGSRSKRPLNLATPAPSTIPYSPCSPPAYYPIRAPSPSLFTQASYGFEENLGFTSVSHAQSGHHMVHCMYQPNFPFMHQQPNSSMNQPPNPSTNQHGFPNCIQLSQEFLAPGLYQESASSNSQFS